GASVGLCCSPAGLGVSSCSLIFFIPPRRYRMRVSDTASSGVSIPLSLPVSHPITSNKLFVTKFRRNGPAPLRIVLRRSKNSPEDGISRSFGRVAMRAFSLLIQRKYSGNSGKRGQEGSAKGGLTSQSGCQLGQSL